MRILYLTHTVTWKGGGIFYTAFHQGRFLARRGHEVTLMSISPSSHFYFSEKVIEGVRIIETPDLLPGLARTGWDAWDMFRRILFLRGKQFDIVHGFESRPVVSLPALFLGKKLGVPVVLTWADLFGKGGRSEERPLPVRFLMAPVESFCEEYFYPKADFVVAMGAPLFQKAVERGISKEKLAVVLHGSDTERIKPLSQETAKLRLGQKLPANTKLLGYLGYLWSANVNLLFQTVRLVKDSLNEPFKLLLIGNHRVDINRIVPEDLRAFIIETGWVSYEDMNLWLCASDGLILPLKKTLVSDSIWPSKLNDYLASGRPIIATEMNILKPVYERRKFGYLSEDNPAALARAVISVITNKAASEEFGSNARLLAEELSWDKIADEIVHLYSWLIDCRVSGSEQASAV